MDQKEIAAFFDRLSKDWDAGMVRNEKVIETILDNAEVRTGVDVLDVACGTGVLIPDYLSRGAGSVLGIDLSPGMIGIAKEKFAGEASVSFMTGDAAAVDFGKAFDCIMVYNALPHFPDPDALVRHLCGFLKPRGTLTVAHGASREKIIRHHDNASRVSVELPQAYDLARVFEKYLKVSVVISGKNMYEVTGVKEE